MGLVSPSSGQTCFSETLVRFHMAETPTTSLTRGYFTEKPSLRNKITTAFPCMQMVNRIMEIHASADPHTACNL